VDGKLIRKVRVIDGKATLAVAFSAGSHKVVAKYTGSSTVSSAKANRRVHA
jgi:hypothetical protein